jgi:hypothetical protein
MENYSAGDLVKRTSDGPEMLIIGAVDDPSVEPETATFFCVWEAQHFLHEEVVPARELSIVRRERRRVPRGGVLDFPVCD